MRGIHYIYTFQIRFEDRARRNIRITSASDRQAIRKCMDALKDLEDTIEGYLQICSIVILEKFPKTQHERQTAKNKKAAQRARRKKEALQKIVKYNGMERIGTLDNDAE